MVSTPPWPTNPLPVRPCVPLPTGRRQRAAVPAERTRQGDVRAVLLPRGAWPVGHLLHRQEGGRCSGRCMLGRRSPALRCGRWRLGQARPCLACTCIGTVVAQHHLPSSRFPPFHTTCAQVKVWSMLENKPALLATENLNVGAVFGMSFCRRAGLCCDLFGWLAGCWDGAQPSTAAARMLPCSCPGCTPAAPSQLTPSRYCPTAAAGTRRSSWQQAVPRARCLCGTPCPRQRSARLCSGMRQRWRRQRAARSSSRRALPDASLSGLHFASEVCDRKRPQLVRLQTANRRLHAKLVRPPSHYSSFRCPVTLSMALLGAGPMASTVRLPGATCVRPAAQTARGCTGVGHQAG